MKSNHGFTALAYCHCGCKQKVYTCDRFDMMREVAGGQSAIVYYLRGHSPKWLANHTRD